MKARCLLARLSKFSSIAPWTNATGDLAMFCMSHLNKMMWIFQRVTAISSSLQYHSSISSTLKRLAIFFLEKRLTPWGVEVVRIEQLFTAYDGIASSSCHNSYLCRVCMSPYTLARWRQIIEPNRSPAYVHPMLWKYLVFLASKLRCATPSRRDLFPENGALTPQGEFIDQTSDVIEMIKESGFQKAEWFPPELGRRPFDGLAVFATPCSNSMSRMGSSAANCTSGARIYFWACHST